MYVVVNTRSGRPRASQCRSISERNCSKPLSLINAHRRSIQSALEFIPQVLEQLVALGIDDQTRGMERPARPLGRLCRPGDDRSEPLDVQPQLVIALEDAGRVRAQDREQCFRERDSLPGVGLQVRKRQRKPVPEQRFEHSADRLAQRERGAIQLAEIERSSFELFAVVVATLRLR